MRNFELTDDGEIVNTLRDKRKRRDSPSWERRPAILRFSITVALLVVTAALSSLITFGLASRNVVAPINPIRAAPMAGSPNVVAGLAVVVRGADGLLYYKLSKDSYWSDWRSFSPPSVGITMDTPTVVAGDNSRLDLFVRGTDDAVWHSSFDGANWSTWESLGGVLTSGPGAVMSR